MFETTEWEKNQENRVKQYQDINLLLTVIKDRNLTSSAYLACQLILLSFIRHEMMDKSFKTL